MHFKTPPTSLHHKIHTVRKIQDTPLLDGCSIVNGICMHVNQNANDLKSKSKLQGLKLHCPFIESPIAAVRRWLLSPLVSGIHFIRITVARVGCIGWRRRGRRGAIVRGGINPTRATTGLSRWRCIIVSIWRRISRIRICIDTTRRRSLARDRCHDIGPTVDISISTSAAEDTP
jgi:hypothetical protein